MDDPTFEPLRRIDEGFEEGSGPYRQALGHGRGPALVTLDAEGFNLRMDVMKAVEAEKARRVEAEKAEFSCPALQGVLGS